MTEHDRVRMERALRVQRTVYADKDSEISDLDDAIVGLQSTDDPSLVPLHDELMERREKLAGEARDGKKKEKSHA